MRRRYPLLALRAPADPEFPDTLNELALALANAPFLFPVNPVHPV
jgi:hypothetical protein